MGYFVSRFLGNTIGVNILVVLVGLLGVLFSLINLKDHSCPTRQTLVLSFSKNSFTVIRILVYVFIYCIMRIQIIRIGLFEH
jgi:hypothetical protein